LHDLDIHSSPLCHGFHPHFISLRVILVSFAYIGQFCIRIACALHIWLFPSTLDAFRVQTEEKQNRKLECPMTPSAKVLYRNLGALPGEITQSQPRRS